MDYIFATIGGSGSRYLIDSLSQKYIVGDKPDAIYQPILKPLRIDPGLFEERSKGFKPKATSLEEVFPEYIDFIARSKSRTAVFNYAAEYGLFSRYRVANVIFQVRHPLHAYISYAKPNRHRSKIDYLGGLNSREAIHYYCKRWIALIQEYKNLKRLGIPTWLLRYEYINEDICNLPDLAWIYTQFDPSKRNLNILAPEAEAFLFDNVEKWFVEIHQEWKI